MALLDIQDYASAKHATERLILLPPEKRDPADPQIAADISILVRYVNQESERLNRGDLFYVFFVNPDYNFSDPYTYIQTATLLTLELEISYYFDKAAQEAQTTLPPEEILRLKAEETEETKEVLAKIKAEYRTRLQQIVLSLPPEQAQAMEQTMVAFTENVTKALDQTSVPESAREIIATQTLLQTLSRIARDETATAEFIAQEASETISHHPVIATLLLPNQITKTSDSVIPLFASETSTTTLISIFSSPEYTQAILQETIPPTPIPEQPNISADAQTLYVSLVDRNTGQPIDIGHLPPDLLATHILSQEELTQAIASSLPPGSNKTQVTQTAQVLQLLASGHNKTTLAQVARILEDSGHPLAPTVRNLGAVASSVESAGKVKSGPLKSQLFSTVKRHILYTPNAEVRIATEKDGPPTHRSYVEISRTPPSSVSPAGSIRISTHVPQFVSTKVQSFFVSRSKGYVGKIALKTFEKVAPKAFAKYAAAQATKTVAVQAAKKVAAQVATKLAAKLGISLAAQAIAAPLTGGMSLLIQAAMLLQDAAKGIGKWLGNKIKDAISAIGIDIRNVDLKKMFLYGVGGTILGLALGIPALAATSAIVAAATLAGGGLPVLGSAFSAIGSGFVRSTSLLTKGTTAGIGAIFAAALLIPAILTFLVVIISHAAFMAPLKGVDRPSGIIPRPGENIDCAGSLPGISPSDPIAARAGAIVDKLLAGFWNYCNKSLDYPELFDEAEYQAHPFHCVYRPNFPSGCTGDYNALNGNSLFWCTWLVIKSYNEAGSSMPTILGAEYMKEWFQGQGRFLPAATAKYNQISPGDAIFLSTTGSDSAGHVAIVYVVDNNNLTSVDSNAATKTHNYTVAVDGRIQSLPGLKVLGFGKH